VRLMERSGRLGGALLFAAAVASRERLGVLMPWWEQELARLGVEVETGVEVGVPDLDAAERAGTAVLLATGSRPYRSDCPVLDAAEFEAAVLAAGSAAAALAAGGTVVVHDPIGDWTGVGVAEQVAAAGRPTAIAAGRGVARAVLAAAQCARWPSGAGARLDRRAARDRLRTGDRLRAPGRANSTAWSTCGTCCAAARSRPVLVYDGLGFHQAKSVAELLAARGCAVEIATPGMTSGSPWTWSGSTAWRTGPGS
jgi:hypothetical protein